MKPVSMPEVLLQLDKLAAEVDWLRDVNAELTIRRDELAAETLQLKHTLAQHGIPTP